LKSRRTVAQRVVAALAALGLFAALAGFAGGAHWALDLLANFRPHGALIAAVVLVLAAAGRFWINASVAALTLLLQLAVVLTPWPRLNAQRDANELRVATVNLHVGNDDPQALIDWVAQTDLALVVVIELSPNAAAKLNAAWRARFAYSEVRPSSGPFGLGVWSRTPISHPQWSALGPLALPSLAVQLPARKLTLLATHPFPPLGASGTAARDLGLAELAQWRQQMPGDVLIAGDLNAAPWSHAFRALQKNAPIYAGSHQFLPWGTWSPGAWPPALGVSLDHLLLSGTGYTVLRREFSPDIGSDHRGVMLALVKR
jgi:endonuclease/exonuclease/phosphatase (EEP) superfamily protein YafD